MYNLYYIVAGPVLCQGGEPGCAGHSAGAAAAPQDPRPRLQPQEQQQPHRVLLRPVPRPPGQHPAPGRGNQEITLLGTYYVLETKVHTKVRYRGEGPY